MTAPALIDSNVLVASVSEAHDGHMKSYALVSDQRRRFAVAAHSLAEVYNTLTRQSAGSVYRWSPEEALSVVDTLRRQTDLVGLTPTQTLDGVRQYALSGGVGARLYDKLIGDVAVVHGISTIITWNLRHMRGLFPALTVEDPSQFLARAA